MWNERYSMEEYARMVVQVFLPAGHTVGPLLDHDIEFITNHAEVALSGESLG